MNNLKLAIAAFGLFALSSFTMTTTVLKSVDQLAENDSPMIAGDATKLFAIDPNEEIKPEVDKSIALHRIQLCEFNNIVPIKVVELMREIGGVTPYKTDVGSIYLTAPYETEELAAADLVKFQDLGFEEAIQVVEIEDELISISQYHENYKKDDDTAANDQLSAIRL